MNEVPLIDLKMDYGKTEFAVRRRIDEVIKSKRFILGPEVEELEEKIAEMCGSRYAVGVSSGTDAILL